MLDHLSWERGGDQRKPQYTQEGAQEEGGRHIGGIIGLDRVGLVVFVMKENLSCRRVGGRGHKLEN